MSEELLYHALETHGHENSLGTGDCHPAHILTAHQVLKREFQVNMTTPLKAAAAASTTAAVAAASAAGTATAVASRAITATAI